MNEKFRAAVYARISISESKSDEDSTSIVNQKKIIEDYCEKNNIRIVDYYVDDGYSGGSFDRPAFNRLIKDIELGVINLVITKDISRLGRDFISTGNYIYKYFPDNNVRYIAILDNYDSLVPTISDDIIPFKAVLNDMYLKDISMKIKSSRHELMRQGLFVGSTVPYGYKRSDSDSRVLEIDPYSAGIVKKIFNLKIRGYSNSFIANKLSEEKILTPNVYNGRTKSGTYVRWNAETIAYILNNQVYVGLLIQRKYERYNLKSKKKRLLNSEEWIIKNNNHEAIIDEEVFEKVKRENKRSVIRHKKYNYLLKGLVKCNDCKNAMIVRRIKGDAVYCCKTYAKYGKSVCKMHYFRESILNKLIIDNLTKLCEFAPKKAIFDSIIKRGDIFRNIDQRIAFFESHIEENRDIIIQLYRDKENGVLSASEFLVLKKKLELDIETNNRIISKLEQRKSEYYNSTSKLVDKIIDFNKNDVIVKFIKFILIDENKDVHIYYTFRNIYA